MKQLSFWASQHIISARFVITGCYLGCNALGILSALFLFDDAAKGATAILFTGLLLGGAALLAYPSKGSGHSYFRRKLFDFALCTATLLIVIGNAASTLQYVPTCQASSIRHEPFLSTNQTQVKGGGFFKKVLQLRNWFGHQKREVQVGLIVLVILAAIGLNVLWAVVCCEISCGGAETLAAILFFAGTAGLIAGSIALCNRIIRGPRQRVKAVQSE